MFTSNSHKFKQETDRTAVDRQTVTDPNRSSYEVPGAEQQAANLDDKEFAKKICDILQRYKWYHGLMPRDEIEEMLVKDGDFLVRRTEVDRKTKLVVSVRSKGRIRHILIKLCDDGQWRLYNVKSESLPDLIEDHVKKSLPVQTDGTILKQPVIRPDYYILHENIIVNKRIGGGAFGEVYKGKLKTADGKSIDAAIKMLKGIMTKKERTTFMKVIFAYHIIYIKG
ncbi:unnamed protein product [Thelazia callipaeda]|uniref:Tyrosine-protein kinase n=1 Tax=Thelazia callipaeda TaxID=103827 RepID=A0A0N5D0Y2_THECL|nr:unnamed protein product [Thelazia callipaeda]